MSRQDQSKNKKYDVSFKDFMKALGATLGMYKIPEKTVKSPISSQIGPIYRTPEQREALQKSSEEYAKTRLIKEIPEQHRTQMAQAALKYDIPVREFSSQMYRENMGFDPEAISTANAVGLAQITPDTVREIRSKGPEELRNFEPRDTQKSYEAAAWYLDFLRKNYPALKGKNIYEVFKAYNAGPGNYTSYGSNIVNIPEFEETRNYVNRIKESAYEEPQPYGGVIVTK